MLLLNLAGYDGREKAPSEDDKDDDGDGEGAPAVAAATEHSVDHSHGPPALRTVSILLPAWQALCTRLQSGLDSLGRPAHDIAPVSRAATQPRQQRRQQQQQQLVSSTAAAPSLLKGSGVVFAADAIVQALPPPKLMISHLVTADLSAAPSPLPAMTPRATGTAGGGGGGASRSAAAHQHCRSLHLTRTSLGEHTQRQWWRRGGSLPLSHSRRPSSRRSGGGGGGAATPYGVGARPLGHPSADALRGSRVWHGEQAASPG